MATSNSTLKSAANQRPRESISNAHHSLGRADNASFQARAIVQSVRPSSDIRTKGCIPGITRRRNRRLSRRLRGN